MYKKIGDGKIVEKASASNSENDIFKWVHLQVNVF